MYGGHIYILSSHTSTLSLGVTNNLYFRVMEHKEPKGRIVFSGLGGRKGANSIDKISIVGVLRLRAPNAVHPINL
jgi:hypothetical protein